VIDEIGRGGMGVVYRARDTARGRDVATTSRGADAKAWRTRDNWPDAA
jgi:hypothetical protein